MTYAEKFKDPRWQKKRLEVLDRDDWACQSCFDGETTLHVHHLYYTANKNPWDYPLSAFLTLCEDCHASEGTERKEYEQTLLYTLKKVGVLSGDILELAYAFSCLNTIHSRHQFTIEAIVDVLQDEDFIEEISKKHLSIIKDLVQKGVRTKRRIEKEDKKNNAST